MARAIRVGAALWLAGAAMGFAAASGKHVPTVDDLLNLQSVGGAQISPDGTRVAYTLSSANFKEDAFVSQIWVANAATGETLQVTRGDKSSTSPRWSPDGQWIAFLSNRIKDKNQVFVIRVAGGEAAQLTKSETAINSFAWSPDGKLIAFAAPEPDGAGQEGPQGTAGRVRGRARGLRLRASLHAGPGGCVEGSPISYVKGARTPTLIQHGENDKRVPIANAQGDYRHRSSLRRFRERRAWRISLSSHEARRVVPRGMPQGRGACTARYSVSRDPQLESSQLRAANANEAT